MNVIDSCPVCLNEENALRKLNGCDHPICTDCENQIKATPNQYTELKTKTKLIKCPLCRAFEKPHYHHLEEELNWYKNNRSNNNFSNLNLQTLQRIRNNVFQADHYNQQFTSYLSDSNRLLRDLMSSVVQQRTPAPAPVQPRVQQATTAPAPVQRPVTRRRVVRGQCTRCHKRTTRKCSYYPDRRVRCSTYCCRNCDQCNACIQRRLEARATNNNPQI
jgi:hypothetical protein